MNTLRYFSSLFLFFLLFGSFSVFAQSGDQILDGIGETGLLARYTFEKDARDWSRNNVHAKIHGTLSFSDDRLFNRVLDFNGEPDSYLTIPGEFLRGNESLSISVWVLVTSTDNNQVLVDAGRSSTAHLSIFSDDNGWTAKIYTEPEPVTVQAPQFDLYRWTHLALAFDAAEKMTRLYVNGNLAASSGTGDLEPDDLFGDAESNRVIIGQSLSHNAAGLSAKLHDLRFYRIPLSPDQVSTIHLNALEKGRSEAQRRQEEAQRLPEFPESTPQLYNQYLTHIPDIEVVTTVGVLPRLPRFVKGIYAEDISGPAVRVIWPAPENNDQVQDPGTYTITGKVPGTNIEPKAIVTINAEKAGTTPGRILETFPLDQVTLDRDSHGQKTKFIENRDKFIEGLANTNPDNFLYMFRNAFGQPQPAEAEPLGGWDSQETKLRGHATGHYLTAIAQAYAGTGYDKTLQTNFSEKMEYMVSILYDLSQLSGKPKNPGGDHVADPALVPPGPGKEDYNSDLSEEGIRTDYWNWGEGYISAYPPDQFIMLEHGSFYGTDESKIWAPYYTLHKILAGLMDVYEVSGNKKALETVKGMGNWVHARLTDLPSDTLLSMWNRYIAGEFGGMNEAMARLYRMTGEPKYLQTARLFDNIRVFYGDADRSHGLAKNVDMIRGLHSNQHIPQIMGALEIYRDSEAPDYYNIADNFWNKATGDYMYSIGGVAGARTPNNAECFTVQPATLYENGFSAGGQNETCATYNMLKLTRNLFLFNPDAQLMDYYERGLYNHILASVAKDSPANTYHVPLRPGAIKHFSNEDMSGFTCCNGTALESSTKLQNSIYFKELNDEAVYVNLFVPSTLDWSNRNVTIRQITSFPNEDHTRLIINGEGIFALKIRVPTWATNGIEVRINGKKETVDAVPGSYLTLSRSWLDGDEVDITMPFAFHLEPVMDQQNIASLFYGPVLLAAQETEARKDWRRITLNAEDPGDGISGDKNTLVFEIDGITFKPFYETYGHHSVYLDVRLK